MLDARYAAPHFPNRMMVIQWFSTRNVIGLSLLWVVYRRNLDKFSRNLQKICDNGFTIADT